jgi:hypothetical protein
VTAQRVTTHTFFRWDVCGYQEETQILTIYFTEKPTGNIGTDIF